MNDDNTANKNIPLINTYSVYNKFKDNVIVKDNCKMYYWIPYIKLIIKFILPFLMRNFLIDRDIFCSFITVSIFIFIANLLYIVFYILPSRKKLIKISQYELESILKHNKIFENLLIVEFLLEDSKEVKNSLKETINSLSKSSFLALIAAIPIFINFLYESGEAQVIEANQYASIVIFSSMVIISIIIDLLVTLGDIPMKLLYNQSLESAYIKNLKNKQNS